MRALVVVLVVSLTLVQPQAARAQQAPPSVPTLSAASAVLVDADDGKILWSKDPHARRSIASTTKVVTALVTLEQTELTDVVTASARAEAVGEDDPLVTELELVEGEQLTVEELLYGLMLPSANDAAVALAEHIGGSEAGFARLMNAKAAHLGADDSNFVTPNGFDRPNAYSTAADLATITAAAFENETFTRIVGTRRYEISGPSGSRQLINRNELLASFPGATGVKTGNTRQAGPSLVSSATRGSESRIAVVLGSNDVFAESAELLEYGYTGFRRHTVAGEGQRWAQLTYGDGTTVDLVASEELTYLLGPGEAPPAAVYRPSEGVLMVYGPIDRTVPVEVVCAHDDCSGPDGRTGGAMARFISLFGSLLALFR
ncbi:MAG: D-alanyl-D-alanine carboxypeptidase family protein [Actinomycetota bacterium]